MKWKQILASSVVAVAAGTVASLTFAGDELQPSQRAALEDALETLEPTAAATYPATFGGLWVDDTTGDGEWDVIRIAFTNNAAARASDVGIGFPRPDLIEGVDVDQSFAQLRTRQEGMIEDRELVRAGELNLPGVPDERYDLNIDIQANTAEIILDAEDYTPTAVAGFKARYGDDVRVVSGSVGHPDDTVEDLADLIDQGTDAAGCSRDNCGQKLRAGLAVTSQNYLCTSAFGVKKDSTGARQLLSAGHCSGSTRFHNGNQYGSVAEEKTQGRVDAERHTADSGWTVKRWIYVNDENKSVRVKSVGDWSGFVVGTQVCRSGWTTGKTCGVVSSKTYAPSYVPYGQDFLRTQVNNDSYCAENGDSGAPVYRSSDWSHAIGIHSGSADAGCDNPGADWGIIGHISNVERELGVTVLTAP